MIILVRAYTHGGGGVGHRQRVSTPLLTRKNSQFVLVRLTGFEPRSFGSRVRRSTKSATLSPLLVLLVLLVLLTLVLLFLLPKS